MHIDLLVRASNETDAIVRLMREVRQLDVPNDRIAFDPALFPGASISEDVDYSGAKSVFRGRLDAARVFLQIDIGFGDAVTKWCAGEGRRF